MKILLVAINAKYIHSNLAVYCLKAYAEKNMPQDVNVQIELAEYTINQNRDEILKDIYRRQAEMVCFSCYIWNLDYVESMIRDVKKGVDWRSKNVKLGIRTEGPWDSVSSMLFFRASNVDGAMDALYQVGAAA